MPNRDDLIKQNRKKRKQHDALIGFLNVLKWLGISIFILTIISVVGMFVVHKIETNQDIEKLNKFGFYNMVSIHPDQEINAVLHGNENSEYTIVPIHDIGEQDLNIFTKQMLSPIENSVQYALINRPGHGFSPDTNKERTTKTIVDEYRRALKELKVDNQVILLAHGFGGVYATNWAAEYPGEVAGIIYIGFEEYVKDFQEYDGKVSTQFDIWSCQLGFRRLSDFDDIRTKTNVYDNDDAEVLKRMYIHSSDTKARNQEITLAKINYDFVFKNSYSPVPKVMVASEGGFATEEDVLKYLRFKNKQLESLGLDPIIDTSSKNYKSEIDKFISNSKSILSIDKINFVNKMDKCLLVRIPGDSAVYRHNPYAVQALIKDFTQYVNKTIIGLKEEYKDTHAEGWEQHQQQSGEQDIPIPKK